jgi:hypothetical protein
MSESATTGWLAACRDEGLDPAELRLVLDRYRAYRAYYVKGQRGEPLPLETWFSWYRMEAASEAQQQAPSPSGCSVDNDARNRGLMAKPAAFLKVLAQLAASEEVR